MSAPQRGRLIEEVIGTINAFYFMKDFVFLDQWYQSGNLKKSLSDLLLVHKSRFISISIKGIEKTLESEEEYKRWLSKQAWRSAKEAKTNLQRTENLTTQSRNLWNEEKEFSANSLTPLCGISLLESPKGYKDALEFEMSLPKSSIPLHVISIPDFMQLCRFLGSIHDVFQYFEVRAPLAHTYSRINQEKLLYAYHVLVSTNDFHGFTACDKAKLQDGFDEYLKRNQLNYVMREQHIKYVNQIIDRLHDRAENYEAYLPDACKRYVEPSSNRKGYLEMGEMLNALSADVKAQFGAKIEEYINNTRGTGAMSHLAYSLNGENPLFVFQFVSGITDRGQRALHLHTLLFCGLRSFSLTDGLAVSINADIPSEGYEILMVRNLTDYGWIDWAVCETYYPEKREISIRTIE